MLGKLDGSSIKGFTDIEESDLVLKPALDTFNVIPWENGLGRMICGIFIGNSRFLKDPRYTTEKLDSYLMEQNLKLFISAELEFFYI
jgi:glutamine synthetase